YKGEIATHGHNKAYPLTEMKVNDKYVHVDDVEPTGEFQPHPFDSHPIMNHYSRSPKAHDSLNHDTYLKESDDFHGDGGGIDSYFDSIESRDPDEHAARGSEKSSPIHKDVEGLNLDDTTKKDIDEARIEPSEKPISDSVDTKQEKAAGVETGKELPKKAPTLQEMKAKLAAIKGNK
ncbi:hypothetical protein GOV06_00655, partial [Candidatus Woesearchaeota archaeon]|nr:hypothetical protein [Candidatus Woesearchaeota archaeon]